MTNTIITEALRIKAKTHAKAICLDVLGKPSSVTTHELRYGSRGSLCICVAGPKAGSYHNFETGKGGDMISLLSDELGGIGQAVRYLSEDRGDTVSTSATVHTIPMPNQPKAKRWSLYAQQIFDASVPLQRTAGEHYLAQRGIVDIPVSEDIRFLERSPYQACPAIVSRITDARVHNDYMSLHFIFMKADGSKAFPLHRGNNKHLLGNHQTQGGVIRTTDDTEVELGLGVAEGLEDALSAMMIFKTPVWAAISAGNIANHLPAISGIDTLCLFGDNDDAGHKAVRTAIKRLSNDGLTVKPAFPPKCYKDWNDYLMGDHHEQS